MKENVMVLIIISIKGKTDITLYGVKIEEESLCLLQFGGRNDNLPCEFEILFYIL